MIEFIKNQTALSIDADSFSDKSDICFPSVIISIINMITRIWNSKAIRTAEKRIIRCMLGFVFFIINISNIISDSGAGLS